MAVSSRIELKLADSGKLCSIMAAGCMSRTPRLESVGVEKERNPPMCCEKQAQRLAKPGEGGGLRRSKRRRSVIVNTIQI